MMNLDFDTLNVKVGFEIHQQLNTLSKLFCNCKCMEANGCYDCNFIRILRPTKSELGNFDKAALFEYAKMNTIKYYSKIGLSCLVEADEEPPHDVNKDALETVLLFSLALNSNIVDEIHVMRKIVIDGSNASGFQRTMLVSSGGYLKVDNFKKIGVQSISLEEDAAKLLLHNELYKEYGLDRLGIPLVEIALEPISGKPDEIVNVALTLGRLLRSSKRVSRGLGSIRQDVNISVNDGQVVEVKGVQQLSQLVKVLDYETKRQFGLIKIADEFKKRNIEDDFIGDKIQDITYLFKNSSSNTIKKILKSSNSIFLSIRLGGLNGLIGYEPINGIRLGKELGEFVRFFGFGGIFHSDELPNYGITAKDIENIKELLSLSDSDAFLIIGGEEKKINIVLEPLIRRICQFKHGVITETRSATMDGTTIFSRPRAGSSRMYPETDILPIPVDSKLLYDLKQKIPLSWNDLIDQMMQKYTLNRKLSEHIFDSQYYDIFEKIISTSKNITPTFIASKLTEDIVSLSRNNLDKSLLTDNVLIEVFDKLDKGSIAKESVTLIFEKIMKKESKSVKEALDSLNLTEINNDELNYILDKIINDNVQLIKEKGINSISALMGKSMVILRGKVDGHKINEYLKQKLERIINDELSA
ncbi:MAG: Glu-tRNA(Gln) amidotransferase subunit GatE [Nitrosopumilus sp.]|nr:Glu-tRNA(Gln) amidotransferase subunit GatE [Nitrosopumilus sp.]